MPKSFGALPSLPQHTLASTAVIPVDPCDASLLNKSPFVTLCGGVIF